MACSVNSRSPGSRRGSVKRADYYDDGDGKYYLETYNKVLALLTWSYFMLFEQFSGGWTYIRYDGKYIRNSEPSYTP